LIRVDLHPTAGGHHQDNVPARVNAVVLFEVTDPVRSVMAVEIKDVEIPEAMQRAMAREAEAERERRAKVINARGELQAAEELTQAAETMSRSPASLQLRYLQTLLELGANQNSTVVFPLPIDILGAFLDKFAPADRHDPDAAPRRGVRNAGPASRAGHTPAAAAPRERGAS
jgi:regulator of protease activity HflC (stomatin/prohibitin superfamily)